eukprot:g12369.t1
MILIGRGVFMPPPIIICAVRCGERDASAYKKRDGGNTRLSDGWVSGSGSETCTAPATGFDWPDDVTNQETNWKTEGFSVRMGLCATSEGEQYHQINVVDDEAGAGPLRVPNPYNADGSDQNPTTDGFFDNGALLLRIQTQYDKGWALVQQEARWFKGPGGRTFYPNGGSWSDLFEVVGDGTCRCSGGFDVEQLFSDYICERNFGSARTSAPWPPSELLRDDGSDPMSAPSYSYAPKSYWQEECLQMCAEDWRCQGVAKKGGGSTAPGSCYFYNLPPDSVQEETSCGGGKCLCWKKKQVFCKLPGTDHVNLNGGVCPSNYFLKQDAHAIQCDRTLGVCLVDDCCERRKCSDVVSNNDHCADSDNSVVYTGKANDFCGTHDDCKIVCCRERKCSDVVHCHDSKSVFALDKTSNTCGTETQCEKDCCRKRKCSDVVTSLRDSCTE